MIQYRKEMDLDDEYIVPKLKGNAGSKIMIRNISFNKNDEKI